MYSDILAIGASCVGLLRLPHGRCRTRGIRNRILYNVGIFESGLDPKSNAQMYKHTTPESMLQELRGKVACLELMGTLEAKDRDRREQNTRCSMCYSKRLEPHETTIDFRISLAEEQQHDREPPEMGLDVKAASTCVARVVTLSMFAVDVPRLVDHLSQRYGLDEVVRRRLKR